MFSLAGKHALVTGSSRGIGFALAQALAGAGAAVTLNGRNPAALEQAAQELRRMGADVHTYLFDVTDGEAVASSVADMESRVGPIDILVNNAGIQRRAPLDQFNDEDWAILLSTNLTSVYLVSKAVAQHMIPRGQGKIINIGSVQCELARPGIAPYTATKGAVRNLTRGMCADWARHGIQANAIAPGYFDTPMNRALVENPEFDEWLRKRTPAGRWGQLVDLHGLVVFLACPASDFVNGQTIFVDGGITSVI